jgi:hypothetical protein
VDRSTSDPLASNRSREQSNPPQPDYSTWRNGAGVAPPQSATAGDPAFDRRVPARTVSQEYRGATRQAFDLGILPPGERPRMVNARSFELEYDVESVGPSGIAKVELWGTRDGGRTWTSFGQDTDKRSPLAVRVDGEGIYGFRIQVQGGNGLGGQPPRENDLPEIWIAVDLTRPSGRIAAVEAGRDPSEMVIRWEANDELPDARPISLFFAEHPRGTWVPIATGLENSGVYYWRLDNRVPGRVYLRLEVRDEAGNVSTFDTPEPILIDQQRPEGHIRGIRPVGSAPQRERTLN